MIFHRSVLTSVAHCRHTNVCSPISSECIIFLQLSGSQLLAGQVMKSTHGQVTKILCGICQGRQLRVDRWAQHSWASALPAHCQELDRRSHGESDWHFFTPMCLISVATSRHVQHELHSLNRAPSNWHVGTVMGVPGKWMGSNGCGFRHVSVFYEKYYIKW